MTNLELKKRIVSECLKIKTQSVNQTKNEIAEIQLSANEYGLPKDRYDSFRTQLLRKRDLFSKQYQKALEEIQLLKKIEFTEECKTVCFGSVVLTDKQKLFVSISIGKINIDGNSYIAISPHVPLFKMMEGLKKGDKFMFNDNLFRVIDLF